mmetsp:Transcript_29476/g.57851  ORF Transcript_29476/g.57851 Transcript_29476/m.57851 type:complete len:95 (+) Transcript_29476:394-678(+)
MTSSFDSLQQKDREGKSEPEETKRGGQPRRKSLQRLRGDGLRRSVRSPGSIHSTPRTPKCNVLKSQRFSKQIHTYRLLIRTKSYAVRVCHSRCL